LDSLIIAGIEFRFLPTKGAMASTMPYLFRALSGKPLTWIVAGDLSKMEASIRALNLGEVRVIKADRKIAALISPSRGGGFFWHARTFIGPCRSIGTKRCPRSASLCLRKVDRRFSLPRYGAADEIGLAPI
jgi:hypothetical protein